MVTAVRILDTTLLMCILVLVTVKAKTLSSWIFENVRKEIAIAEKDQKPEANEERKKKRKGKGKKNRNSKEKESMRRKKSTTAHLLFMLKHLFFFL